jgi:hypothetical protein
VGAKHAVWLERQKIAHASQQEMFVDYLNEVKRARERLERDRARVIPVLSPSYSGIAIFDTF